MIHGAYALYTTPIFLWNKIVSLTSCHADEVLSRCFVDLDVPIADVVLVSAQRHVPVTHVLKKN